MCLSSKSAIGNSEILLWYPRNNCICNLLLTSNLVSHSLGLNDGDVINDSLVEVEILGKSIEGKGQRMCLWLLTFRSTSQ